MQNLVILTTMTAIISNPSDEGLYRSGCDLAARVIGQPESHFVQSVSNLQQLEELFAIDREAYGDNSISWERFQEWWTLYPQGSRVLLKDGQILASIGIYPLSDEQFESFTQGTIAEECLKPVPSDECDLLAQHYWYVSGIVISKEMRDIQNRSLGDLIKAERMLKSLMQLAIGSWLTSGHVAYPFEVIAIELKPEISEKVLIPMGFKKERDGSEMPDGCDLYHLRINSERSASNRLRIQGL